MLRCKTASSAFLDSCSAFAIVAGTLHHGDLWGCPLVYGEVGEVALDVSERGGNGVASALQTCARLEQVLGLAVVSAAV